MSGDGGGFLARWSRKKAGLDAVGEAQAAAPLPPSGPAAPPAPTTLATAPDPTTASADAAANAPGQGDVAPAPPLPTLADVAALTRESDYSRFMLPGVDATVRNAAMKKLFSDPRYNVMDGLDTYIDDYGKPDPLPLSMLRRMQQSAALGLFDAEPAAPPAPVVPPPVDNACPDGAAREAVAPSPPSDPLVESSSRAEDDPDLRLQPDDVDRRPGAGAGPRS